MAQHFVVDIKFRIQECNGSHFFDIIPSSFFKDFVIRDGLPEARREAILVGKGSNQRIKFSYIRVVGARNVV